MPELDCDMEMVIGITIQKYSIESIIQDKYILKGLLNSFLAFMANQFCLTN